MGRKFFVGGNWKMNGDKAAIEGICNTLKSADTDSNVGKLSVGAAAVGCQPSLALSGAWS